MAKIPLRYLPIAGIFLLLCLIGYFLVKAGYKGVDNAIINEVLQEPGLTGKGFEYNYDNLVIYAEKGTYSQDKQKISLNDLVLKIKPLSSPYAMELKGDKADYDTSEKVMRLSGNLKGSSDNGYKLFTEYLVYDQKEGILKTDEDEPVKITGPFSMTGKGLILNLEKETVHISDVKALFEKGS